MSGDQTPIQVSGVRCFKFEVLNIETTEKITVTVEGDEWSLIPHLPGLLARAIDAALNEEEQQ